MSYALRTAFHAVLFASLLITPALLAQDALPAPDDVAAPPDTAEVTDTGLASVVLQEGTGEEHPGPVDTVKVHYTGWTTDGKMVDSSRINVAGLNASNIEYVCDSIVSVI